MIQTIVALIGGWRAAAFLALALAAITWGGAEHYHVNSAHAALATLQAQVAEAGANAQTIARAESERRDTAASSATQSMLDYLGANLPSIETRTHDTIERIRTVYRDRPVPAVCQRPDSVRAELDAARARANGAAPRGLPAQRTSSGSANPDAGSHGRMGDRRDGDHRGGESDVDIRVGLHGQAQSGARDPMMKMGMIRIAWNIGVERKSRVSMRRETGSLTLVGGTAGTKAAVFDSFPGPIGLSTT